VTFDAGNATTVDESGSAEHRYEYTIFDPGDDTVDSVDVGCGSGTLVTTGPNAPTNDDDSGSFACIFPDGPTDTAVSAAATDSDGDEGATATQAVHVNNVAPAVAFVAPLVSAADEGDTKTFSFSVTDPGVDAFSAAPAFPDCGTGGLFVTGSYAAVSGGGTFQCRFPDGPSTATDPTVRMRVRDSDLADSNIASQLVDVANVNPTLSNSSFTYNPFTGSASAGIDYSDPGYPDTHSAVFDWAGSSDTTPGHVGAEHVYPNATGRFTSTHSFGAGCITGAVRVTVTDDDGGFETYEFAPAGSLARYTATWQAPVKDGMRNVVKHGNVIPLKIRVVDCNGNAVTGKTFTVGVTQGIVSSQDIEDGTYTILPTESVGAHTDGIMRYVDSHYMYNLATKNLTVNHAYTIVIREQSTNLVVTTAVIEAKKN
jgi:hypothetical protein